MSDRLAIAHKLLSADVCGIVINAARLWLTYIYCDMIDRRLKSIGDEFLQKINRQLDPVTYTICTLHVDLSHLACIQLISMRRKLVKERQMYKYSLNKKQIRRASMIILADDSSMDIVLRGIPVIDPSVFVTIIVDKN